MTPSQIYPRLTKQVVREWCAAYGYKPIAFRIPRHGEMFMGTCEESGGRGKSMGARPLAFSGLGYHAYAPRIILAFA